MTSGLGGLAAVRFSGGQYMYTALTDTAGWTGCTFVTVIKTQTTVPQYSTVLGSGGQLGHAHPTTGIRWGLLAGTDATWGMGWGGSLADVPFGPANVAASTGYVMVWKKTGTGSWTIRKNGTTINTVSDSTFPSGTFQAYLGAEGKNGNTVMWPATLDLSEVRIYNKRSEERRVGRVCRSRWSPYH